MAKTDESPLLQLDILALDQISQFLQAKDFTHLSMTNRTLNEHFTDERFWQRFMNQHKWISRRSHTNRTEFKSILNNAPINHVETNSFNRKVVRYITYSHDGSMMAAFGNGCRLWIFRGETEIHHEYLSTTRKWDKVMTVEFSPDDKHLLVTGHNDPFFHPGNGRKSLIFKIGEEIVTMKSFVLLDPQMLSTWYDNQTIIFMCNDGNRDRMRLYMSDIDNQADIIIYPILSFNIRVTKILVAQHVSPRARKIVQIANEAAEAKISLHERLTQIGLASDVDVTDMNALRAILDQNSECMPCYRLHAHRGAVEVARCDCTCHNNTDKMLIFHGNDSKVYMKVITKETIDIAKQAFTNRDDPIYENRLFHPLQVVATFDTVDCSFDIGSSLLHNAACFSPDHKFLYITGTRKAVEAPRAPFMEIKPTCIDLETMTIHNIPDFEAKAWVAYEYDVRITANREYLAIFTNNEVVIWSTFQQGKAVTTLSGFLGMISSVTIHPYLNRLLITNERLVHTYQSPLMCIEDEE